MKIKIGNFQFFCVIFLFELGSAVLFGMAKGAKQDAWIPILIGTVCGCIIYTLYIKLYERYPTLPLTSYTREILGKYLGWVVGFAYVLYFIYLAIRVLRDFEELLVISQYHNTSLYTLGLYMIASIIYVMFKGFEVFARVSQVCFYIYILTTATIFTLEIADDLIRPEYLLPLLEKGWSPVFKAFFPATFSVPFGEMIAFTMILPFLKDRKSAKKIGYIGIIVSGMYLTVRTLMNIAVINPDVRFRSTFPTLTEVGLVDIGEFIQRLDSLILVSLVILGFAKIFLFYYCALLGTKDLFNYNKTNKLIFPFGAMIIIFSVLIAPNFNIHLKIGLEIVPIYFHIPFQIIIPALLLFIAFLKSKYKKTNQQKG